VSSGSSDRAVLAAVALSGTLLPLNSTMLAVALPDIASGTGGGLAASTWLVTAYVVAMAALGPFAGRLGDRLGRRRMVLAGLGGFAVASAAAGLAPSLAPLVAARLGQAVAGSLVFPNAIALLRDALPAGRRAGGFGILGSVVGAAAATGPVLGGVLVGAFGWRAIFLVNLPVVALAAALTLRALPAAVAPAPADAGPATRAGGWLRPLRVPVFAAATGAVGLSNLTMYSTLLAVPVVLAGRPGWSPSTTGLALAVLSLGMVAVAPLGGRLADRAGHRRPAVAGLALLAAATAGLATMGAAPPAAGLVVALLGAGIGLGLAGAPLQAAAVEAVDPGDAGLASGLFSTGRYTGSIVSAGLLAGVLGHGGAHAATLFALTAATAAAAAVLALRLGGAAPAATRSATRGRPSAPPGARRGPCPEPARPPAG
jgi:MFS family permease